MKRIYICIDLKSFYASVECVHRGLDPLKAKLLVADESRSDQTICLAVSPALKAIGVPCRPRLFEAKQAIARYEKRYNTKVDYITAVPRMAESEDIIPQANSSTFIMKADASPNFRNYSIKKDSLLFINPDEPYEPGKLSMYKNGKSYLLLPDKKPGYEYMGRLMTAINYYF